MTLLQTICLFTTLLLIHTPLLGQAQETTTSGSSKKNTAGTHQHFDDKDCLPDFLREARDFRRQASNYMESFRATLPSLELDKTPVMQLLDAMISGRVSTSPDAPLPPAYPPRSLKKCERQIFLTEGLREAKEAIFHSHSRRIKQLDRMNLFFEIYSHPQFATEKACYLQCQLNGHGKDCIQKCQLTKPRYLADYSWPNKAGCSPLRKGDFQKIEKTLDQTVDIIGKEWKRHQNLFQRTLASYKNNPSEKLFADVEKKIEKLKKADPDGFAACQHGFERKKAFISLSMCNLKKTTKSTKEANPSSSRGSCFYTKDENGSVYLTTAKHTVASSDELRSPSQNLSSALELQDGGKVSDIMFSNLESNKFNSNEWDAIAKPVETRALALPISPNSAAPMKIGETLYIAGYPGSRSFRYSVYQCFFAGKYQSNETGGLHNLLHCPTAIRPVGGMSGGVQTNGQLASGIITSQTPNINGYIITTPLSNNRKNQLQYGVFREHKTNHCYRLREKVTPGSMNRSDVLYRGQCEVTARSEALFTPHRHSPPKPKQRKIPRGDSLF